MSWTKLEGFQTDTHTNGQDYIILKVGGIKIITLKLRRNIISKFENKTIITVSNRGTLK